MHKKGSRNRKWRNLNENEGNTGAEMDASGLDGFLISEGLFDGFLVVSR